MKSVFQRLVAYHEALQNIHPLEDGSGQARLPESSTPVLGPMESPHSHLIVEPAKISFFG